MHDVESQTAASFPGPTNGAAAEPYEGSAVVPTRPLRAGFNHQARSGYLLLMNEVGCRLAIAPVDAHPQELGPWPNGRHPRGEKSGHGRALKLNGPVVQAAMHRDEGNPILRHRPSQLVPKRHRRSRGWRRIGRGQRVSDQTRGVVSVSARAQKVGHGSLDRPNHVGVLIPEKGRHLDRGAFVHQTHRGWKKEVLAQRDHLPAR